MSFRIFSRSTASSISLTALALTTLLQSALALNDLTSKGCFSSSNGLQFQGTYMYQSQGYCQQQCVNKNKPVMGLTNGGDCWCGDLLPPQDSGTDDSKCSAKCLGFGEQPCGGNGVFGVFLTGTQMNVANAQSGNGNKNNQQPNNPPPNNQQNNGPAPAPIVSTIVQQGPPIVQTLAPETVTAPGQSTTLPPQVVTVGGGTQVITLPGSTATQAQAGAAATSDAPSPSATASSGTSTGAKVGIAIGAIVAVLIAAGGVGWAVFYFLKKKKRADYSGSAANGAGAAGSGNLVRNNTMHSHSTSGGFGGSQWGGHAGSVSDSRLDPNIVETRRTSEGSIFDDGEDYSRRILKVTNPSG